MAAYVLSVGCHFSAEICVFANGFVGVVAGTTGTGSDDIPIRIVPGRTGALSPDQTDSSVAPDMFKITPDECVPRTKKQNKKVRTFCKTSWVSFWQYCFVVHGGSHHSGGGWGWCKKLTARVDLFLLCG